MSPLLESLFEFLFKYKPFVFGRGDLVLSSSWTSLVLGLVLAAAAIPVLRRYRDVGGKSTARDRAILTALRVGVFALLLLCLLRPALVVATAVPQQNFVGILLDDSRSMRIEDLDGRSRADVIAELLGAESPLLASLSDRFKIRFFSFAASAGRVEGVAELGFRGGRTDLTGALDRARQELASLPLSGLVVVTDGADNAAGGMTETLGLLHDADVPVFAVGVGAEEFSRDVEIVRVETPRDVLEGSSVGADVVIRQRGYDGATVQLLVEDDGRVLNSVDVELPRSGETATVKVRFMAQDPGARVMSFRILPQDGEMVAQNNQLDSLVSVRDDKVRILYFEGEPRFEVAFMRRALALDENLQIALLQRTAENKFYRLMEPDERFGGDAELFAGFPRTREELYAYSGIILGSVEASFFTPDQLRMIADFVSQRGGGFMALGGRHSFSGGGYGGTPVQDVLPVVLDGSTAEAGPEQFSEVNVQPTLFGRSHPAVQLADDPQENLARWRSLPPLSALNRLTRTKPGAVTLLEGLMTGGGDPQVVLAYQRYGAGKALALTVMDTWQWQMHQDIALEDTTHETLWQQILRWLVTDVEGQVRGRLGRDRFGVGEPVEIVAEVLDDTYLAVNNATVVARVTRPSGLEETLPLQWNVEVDGEYRASFVPEQDGFYRVEVEAGRAGELIGSHAVTGQAAELTQEFFAAELNRELLERVAEETGGRFYTTATAAELADDIQFATGGTTVTEVLDLWDMPIVFFLLVALAGTEWGYRKMRRLA